jgi:hypothetical protein
LFVQRDKQVKLRVFEREFLSASSCTRAVPKRLSHCWISLLAAPVAIPRAMEAAASLLALAERKLPACEAYPQLSAPAYLHSMIGNGCGRGIIPANLRQRGERYIELIARLQVVKSMSESAELIQFAQRIQGHIVFSGDGRRGLAGLKGIGAVCITVLPCSRRNWRSLSALATAGVNATARGQAVWTTMLNQANNRMPGEGE